MRQGIAAARRRAELRRFPGSSADRSPLARAISAGRRARAVAYLPAPRISGGRYAHPINGFAGVGPPYAGLKVYFAGIFDQPLRAGAARGVPTPTPHPCIEEEAARLLRTFRSSVRAVCEPRFGVPRQRPDGRVRLPGPPGPILPAAGGVMDSAILSLLGAFVLSIIGLFVFIWSLRKGLLVENPAAAGVIFARGEIGRVDDPALAQLGPAFDARGRAARLRARRRCGRTPGPDRGRPLQRLSGVHVRGVRLFLATGGLAGRPHLLDQAARAGLAHQPGMADLRAHPHRPPDGGAVRLDHQCGARGDPVAAAPSAAHPPAGRDLDHAGRRPHQHRHRGRNRRRLGGLVRRHGTPRDPLADRHLRPGRLRARRAARAVHAGQPQGGAPVRQRLVHGGGAAVDLAAVPGGQAARRAHGRAAGHHQLVVWPHCAGPVVHAGQRGRDLLLPAENHRAPGALVQPVHSRLLDAGLLLRAGRRTSPDRRPGPRLAPPRCRSCRA